MAEVGVGERELAARRRDAEPPDRLVAHLGRLLRAAQEAVQARQGAQAVALEERVAEGAAQGEGALLRGDRRVELAGQEALVGAALEQPGLLGGREVVGKAQSARVLGGGLAMGAERRRALGGRRREAQHGRPVPGHVGVVGDAGRVPRAARARRKRRGRAAMERHPAMGRQRLLDGQARQLVAERDAVGLRGDHARGQALLQMVELVGRERLQEPDLGLRRRDRDRLEQAARGLGQARDPRQDRVAHRGRDHARPRREHLGHVEGVAVRPAVQVRGVDPVRLGELADGRRRQRRDRDPRHRPRGRQLAQDERQRVRAVELVVAIAGEHERGDRVDLARQQAQHVERRLVGPVQVLEHEDRRAAPASSRISAAVTSCGLASRETSSASSPPVASATSNSGPSGPGVRSPSQAPHRTRAASPRASQKACRSTVFPAPASPPTKTTVPAASALTAASASARVAS